MHKKFINIFSLCGLFFLLGLLVWVNWNYAINYIHSDVVNEATFMQMAWEQKSIFPEGYIAANEGFGNRLWIIFGIFYTIFDDFIIAQKLTTITGMVIMVVLLEIFLKQLGFHKIAITMSLLLFLGYNAQGEVLFLFFPAYAGFVIVLLLSFIIKNAMLRGEKRNHRRVLLFAYFAMAFYIGLGSPKMTVVIYFPLFLVDVVFWLRKSMDCCKIVIDQRLRKVIFSGTALMVNLSAYVFSLLFYSGAFIPISLRIKSLDEIFSWEAIATQIKCLLRALNFTDGGSITSYEGIMFLLALTWLIILCCFSVALIQRKILVEEMFFFLCSTLTMFLMSMLFAVDSAPRYYFVTNILFSVVVGGVLDYFLKRDIWAQVPLFLLIVVSVIISQTKCVWYMSSDNEEVIRQTELKEIASFMEDNDYNVVAGQYWNVGVLKGLSNGYINVCSFYPSINQFSAYIWLTDMRAYEQTGEVVLVLTDDEEYAMYNSQNMKVILLNAVKIKECGRFNLYLCEKNPLKLISLPDEKGEVLKYDFIDWPECYVYGNIEERGIVSQNTGVVFMGPRIYANGEYDIVVKYEAPESCSGAVGYLYLQGENGEYAQCEMIADEKEAIFKNVRIEKEEYFEVVGVVNTPQMVFENITFVRSN